MKVSRSSRLPRRFFAAVALFATAGCQHAAPNSAIPPAPTPAGERTFTRAEVQKLIADLRWIDTTRGINETRRVQIGGITQLISIRGRDRRNPILLFVHGGPASPTWPGSWFFQSPWEEYFTVVQWDQRGAGKTAAANDVAAVNPTINIQRMSDDGSELVAYLRNAFHKEKIFLMGHSWGTVIGVNVAQRHPEWLHAYIGIGQVVDGKESEKLSYEWALARARELKNATAAAELEKIAPYPNDDGTVPIDKILVERKWVIAFGGLTWGRPTFDYEVNAVNASPDYDARDIAAIESTDLTSLKQLLGPPNVLNYKSTTRFGCPVFFFGGKYDYETVTEVVRRWYDTIDAPKKGFVFFDHSAHMLMFEEPAKLLEHLVHDVRPIAVAAGDAPSGER